MKKKILITLVIMMSIICLVEKPKADTLNYNSIDYRLFWYEFDGDNWKAGSNSYTNAGTSINVKNKGVWAWNTAIHLGNNTMVAGRTYKITMTYTMSPANNLLYRDYKNQIYWDNPVGSGNSNGTNASEENIDRFSATYQPNCESCARNSVIYYVTPAVDIKYLQVRLRIKDNNMELTGHEPYIAFNSVNQPAGDYIKITWTTDESAIAIQEQTEIIKEESEKIRDILEEDHEYNQNESQSTQEQREQMNNFEEEEETLRNNLNLNIEDSEITINPNASSFIWEVVNRLRAMNGKIVLLFTSVLSLGIMKMILGR